MRIARWTWVMLTIAATSGCAALEGPAAPQVGNENAQMIDIRVENDTGSSLRIYALVGGQETLLGRVGALQAETVQVHRTLGSRMQLMVRPSAATVPGRRHVSEPFSLSPGQRVVWNLRASPSAASVPRMSTIRIFHCAPASGC